MRFLWRWLKRGVLAVVVLVVLLLLPIGYTELACRGEATADAYTSLIAEPEWQRAESRTLMTYPEWHIVHAYDDYAQVITAGDPHDFDYLRAVAGFWTSLCPLMQASAEMGGVTAETKMTTYTIGVSFTAELLAKALYEETIGRIVTIVRGDRAPLDDLSAEQAVRYAQFLQQTPWYKWDFFADKSALDNAAGEGLRDRERALALGLEYSAKAAYAGVIEQAVAGVGADDLRLRSIVSGLSVDALEALDGVTVIETRPEGVLVETDRYRVYTRLLERIAAAGGDMVEIAGNDEVLFTVTGPNEAFEGALYSFPRQGYGDWRHLVLVPVVDLTNRLRALDGGTLEHVHDY
ncbi:hypothetical protein N9L47_09175 [Rhodobacteraceae bacterium]|nr:hypothetical protein [Paracoccaceae bacterium]